MLLLNESVQSQSNTSIKLSPTSPASALFIQKDPSLLTGTQFQSKSDLISQNSLKKEAGTSSKMMTKMKMDQAASMKTPISVSQAMKKKSNLILVFQMMTMSRSANHRNHLKAVYQNLQWTGQTWRSKLKKKTENRPQSVKLKVSHHLQMINL